MRCRNYILQLTEQLQNVIRASGQTLNALSKVCGVNRSILSRFLRDDEDLRLKTVEKIAAALGLDAVLVEGRAASKRKRKGKGE